MPGIRISNVIKNRLPENQKSEIETALKNKSNDTCFLCEAPFNYASDDIVPDHDIPTADEGPTELNNLNLAHADCNSFKKDHSTAHVRPFLEFRRFLSSQSSRSKYDATLPHFKITPKMSVCTLSQDKVSFQFPDGTETSAEVFEDIVDGVTFRYCFVAVPREGLYNDENTQPRTIKIEHVWSIYHDLLKNPLNEPPSCRTDSSLDTGEHCKIKMFDGQHKTVSTWLTGKTRVVCKIYFNMSDDHAVRLVNSVQSRIKKLGLSSFELAVKMGDEFEDHMNNYNEVTPYPETSEEGFFEWLPSADRSRGKLSFKSALAANLLEDKDLAILDYVRLAGSQKETHKMITENALKSKVLERLLHVAPLAAEYKQAKFQEMRDLEADNIRQILNIFSVLAFVHDPGDEKAKTRQSRMVYQSALVKISDILKDYFAILSGSSKNLALLTRNLSVADWDKFKSGVQRLVDHPAWYQNFNTENMVKVQNALQKNQNIESAFNAVYLSVGYVQGSTELPGDWAGESNL